MNVQSSAATMMAQKSATVVVTATRAWVWSIMAQACETSRGRYVRLWDDCFDRLGGASMVKLWGSFMRHLSINGKAQFLLGCHGCGRLSEDEGYLVQCLAAHQHGLKREACGILERWFEGEALWKADALAEAFADELSRQGHSLPHAVDSDPGHPYPEQYKARHQRLN